MSVPSLLCQMYSLLLGSLLTHCQYPDGFEGWENSMDDEDDFSIYRSGLGLGLELGSE